MEFLFWLVLALAPGLFWLWFFVRKDRFRPEPRRLLALTFFGGMVSTIPAAIAEGIFLDDSILAEGAAFASVAVSMLLVVGPVEEFSKYLVVRFGAFRSLYFDEPTDGLVYAATASLGFASLENLVYVAQFGPAVMLVRAPLSTLAHLIFSSYWGYALGARTREGASGKRGVIWGLTIAAVLHALFNLSLFLTPWIAVAIVVVGGVWTVRQFEWTQRISPFRGRENHPQIECQSCWSQIDAFSRFCQFCDAVVEPNSVNRVICGRCGTYNRTYAKFCVRCGDKFLSQP